MGEQLIAEQQCGGEGKSNGRVNLPCVEGKMVNNMFKSILPSCLKMDDGQLRHLQCQLSCRVWW